MVEGAEAVVVAIEGGSDHPRDYEQFVLEQSVALQRFAYLIAGNSDDARDAVQDALLRVYPHWESLSGDRGAYLRRSIVNAHRSRWRKHRRETPVADVRSATGPARDADSVLDWLVLDRLARQLPYRQRVAVVLRYYEDRSFAEIADVLGCAEASARSLVHRALASLRNGLGRGSDD